MESPHKTCVERKKSNLLSLDRHAARAGILQAIAYRRRGQRTEEGLHDPHITQAPSSPTTKTTSYTFDAAGPVGVYEGFCSVRNLQLGPHIRRRVPSRSNSILRTAPQNFSLKVPEPTFRPLLVLHPLSEPPAQPKTPSTNSVTLLVATGHPDQSPTSDSRTLGVWVSSPLCIDTIPLLAAPADFNGYFEWGMFAVVRGAAFMTRTAPLPNFVLNALDLP